MFLRDKKNLLFGLGVLIFILSSSLLIKTVFPPADFPTSPFFHVDRGKSVSLIAEELKEKKFIQSTLAFKIFVKALGGEKRLQVGTYFFKQPTSAINIALRITQRFLGYEPITVVIYEGMSNEKIAKLLMEKIPDFPKEEFLEKTKNLEGQLFPDTYFFSPFNTVDDVIYELNENFKARLAPLKVNILLSGKTLGQILTMASLIERETNNDQDRRLVSGILWRRIAIDMPLQVDATFEYYTEYNTYTIPLKVMKENSPYNTYTNKGLPPTPIANPGLASIEAAIYPENSPYLYYLTGRDGKMYYAEDFDGHKKNRRLYLD